LRRVNATLQPPVYAIVAAPRHRISRGFFRSAKWRFDSATSLQIFSAEDEDLASFAGSSDLRVEIG
jgi:hypothetical protein